MILGLYKIHLLNSYFLYGCYVSHTAKNKKVGNDSTGGSERDGRVQEYKRGGWFKAGLQIKEGCLGRKKRVMRVWTLTF